VLDGLPVTGDFPGLGCGVGLLLSEGPALGCEVLDGLPLGFKDGSVDSDCVLLDEGPSLGSMVGPRVALGGSEGTAEKLEIVVVGCVLGGTLGDLDCEGLSLLLGRSVGESLVVARLGLGLLGRGDVVVASAVGLTVGNVIGADDPFSIVGGNTTIVGAEVGGRGDFTRKHGREGSSQRSNRMRHRDGKFIPPDFLLFDVFDFFLVLLFAILSRLSRLPRLPHLVCLPFFSRLFLYRLVSSKSSESFEVNCRLEKVAGDPLLSANLLWASNDLTTGTSYMRFLCPDDFDPEALLRFFPDFLLAAFTLWDFGLGRSCPCPRWRSIFFRPIVVSCLKIFGISAPWLWDVENPSVSRNNSVSTSSSGNETP
jgi:hypothetical protein